MSLQGRFEMSRLGSLLQMFGDIEKTGVLTMTNGKEEAKIYLKEGSVVYASSSQREFRLGNLLRVNGILSETELQGFLKKAEAENQKLGAFLVKAGHMSKETLKKILRDQVEEIVCSIFFWDSGEFEYKDVSLSVEPSLVSEINPMEIVLEASRRIDEWSIIRKDIPSDKVIFRMSSKAQDQKQFKLNQKERDILSIIDGKKNIRGIMDESGYDEFMGYKILYSMMTSGIIEKTS